jgi:hypothetical protein
MSETQAPALPGGRLFRPARVLKKAGSRTKGLKKMILRLTLIALALLAAGCGPTMEYWCHRSLNSVEAIPKQKYECETDALQRASLRGEKGDDDVIADEWKNCMQARGWFICEGPRKEDLKKD